MTDFEGQLAVHYGAHLRALRQKRGWSRSALARRTGIDGLAEGTIGAIERGEQLMAMRTMAKLAIAFECDPADLVPRLPAEMMVNGRYPQTTNDLPFPSLDSVAHEPKRAVGA